MIYELLYKSCLFFNMKDEGSFEDKQTKKWVDICGCRVTFATEKPKNLPTYIPSSYIYFI